jgi:hypothetical protein
MIVEKHLRDTDGCAGHWTPNNALVEINAVPHWQRENAKIAGNLRESCFTPTLSIRLDCPRASRKKLAMMYQSLIDICQGLHLGKSARVRPNFFKFWNPKIVL